jgi:RNA polymerase sigma-70 factor (ECF subfamily)
MKKPYEQIAEITGITENNLRVKIHRIKKELTEIFHKYARL